MQSGANWYWKISKSIKTRGTKDSARQNTNYLMSSPSSATPIPRSLLSLPGRRRGGGGGGGGRGGGGERGGKKGRGDSFPCKNSIPLGIEVSKTRMGIYITHSHLAYLPNKGFSRPLPQPLRLLPLLRHPRSIKRTREVSARQSLGMTMLIPRMNAS